jgi:uncharacterized protein with HEPN domain
MSPDRAFLEDILQSGRLALQYVETLSLIEFEADLKTQDAVIRRLEVIGEAAKWIESDVKAAMPLVQWRRISGMRNFVIHEYWDVDLTIVWSTVHDDLPPLIQAIETYLSSH